MCIVTRTVVVPRVESLDVIFWSRGKNSNSRIRQTWVKIPTPLLITYEILYHFLKVSGLQVNCT